MNAIAIAMSQNNYATVNGVFQSIPSENPKPTHVFVIFEEDTDKERTETMTAEQFEAMFEEDPCALITEFLPVTARTSR